MNKKVIIGIVAVVAVIAVIVGIVLMTKGGSNSKIETETLTWND